MKVLVTGGTGFVGPKIVNAIADAGHWVRVLEREPGSWKKAGLRCQEAVQGDLTDPDSLRAAAAGCDAFVQLVAIITGSKQDFERIMEQGNRNALAAAKDAGVGRFVLMSALGTTEETKEVTPYFHAKWTMEQDVKASGLQHVIFRPSFVLGKEGGTLKMFRRIARLSPVTPVVGPGTDRIQPIWGEDVGAYFAASLDKPEAANRTFEIGGPDIVTWDELWKRLKKTMGVHRPTMHIPFGLMRAQAAVLERLPKPIVTRDQLKMIEAGDNVVTNSDAVDTFGLPLVPLDEQLRRGV